MRRIVASLAAAAVLVTAGTATAQQSSTLEKTKRNGYVSCGRAKVCRVSRSPDQNGVWSGFDIDWCRAVAAAIFNDPNAARYKSLSARDRLLVLQSGEIDMLARTTTWTSSRDTAFGLNFTAINYFDGQGFLVRKAAKIVSAKELDGASVCIQQGTTGELNLADFTRTNKIRMNVVGFATIDGGVVAFQSGRCDAWTTDISALSANKLKFDKPTTTSCSPR